MNAPITTQRASGFETSTSTSKRKESDAEFCPLPLHAIEDKRLTLLELRVLGVISYHDRLSIPRGKGQGAWVSQDKIAKRLGAHFTSVSSAIAKLAKLGYLTGERHPLNKRLRVYRVIYHTKSGATLSGEGKDDGSALSDAGQYTPQILSSSFEIGELNQANGGVEYISQSDGRYSAKAEEDIPLSGASCISATLLGLDFKANGRDTPESGLRNKLSLTPHLSDRFLNLPLSAQLVRFDEAFGAIGRDADLMESHERSVWAAWLFAAADENSGEQVGYQALRLLEEFEM